MWKIVVLRFLALAAALACIALVGTIELLSHRAGDAIGRKQHQEPHSKWRISSPGMHSSVAESEFRQEREIPENQPLTSEQAVLVENLAQGSWAKAIPHDHLARTMRTYSAWGAPLGLLASVSGAVAFPKGNAPLRTTCISIGALTFLITLLRYIPSLG